MKYKFSFLAFILIAVTIVSLIFRFPKNLFAWDNFGFYMYLPNIFIYRDINLRNLDFLQQIINQYNISSSMYQLEHLTNGNNVDRFTMGIAIMLSPFFLIAHITALLFGYEANGYSAPYHWMVHAGTAFYAILGFFIIRKILLKFFDDISTAAVLLIFFAGTNIFLFACLGNPWPHIFAFTLYTFLLYFTIRWHESPGVRWATLLGLTIGLLFITRISEAIAIIIPLFWNVYDKETLIRKYRLLVEHRKHVLYLIIAGIVAVLPQLAYWFAVTGQVIYFPYSDPSSSLELTRPRFAWVLFSYRKGWLLYSPLMAISIFGLILLYKKRKAAFYPVLIFFLINLYLIASFTSLVSYGYRAFIQSYAVMIIPFGYSIEWFLKQRSSIRIAGWIVILTISYINIFQAWQIRTGIIPGRRVSKAYYWKVFLKSEFHPEDRKLLLIQRIYDEPEKLKNEEDFNERTLFFNGFENPSGAHVNNYASNPVYEGNLSFRMDSTVTYGPGFEYPYNKITQKEYAWIRPSVKVFPVDSVDKCDVRLVIAFSHRGRDYKYYAAQLEFKQFNAKPGQWNTIVFDYLTPEVISKKDQMKVYLWHPGKGKVYIDDLKVEVFTLD